MIASGDLRGPEDHGQIEFIAHRDHQRPRSHVNGIPELIGLLLHLQYRRLDGGLRRCHVGCDQVLVARGEQRRAVEDRRIVEQDAVYLLVDGLLRSRCVQSGYAGQEADIVIDECLARHGELLRIGFELPLRQQLRAGQVGLDLAVLRNLQEVADTADDVLVVCSLLEVRKASFCRELLERGRHMVVQLHDGLLDGAVHDGRKCRRRIVELPRQLCIKLIRAPEAPWRPLPGLRRKVRTASSAHRPQLCGTCRSRPPRHQRCPSC